MREVTTPRSSQNYLENEEPSPLMTQLGQAAMIFTGAALMALAAKERSWRTLGIAAAGAPLLYRGATGRWPVPEKFAQSASDAVSPVPIEAAVTIGKPADELYRFWRQLENLPRFMKNLDSVTESDGRHSHWVGRSPLGFKMEWDAEILDEREGKLLSWRSLPDSDVQNAGTVFFDQAASERGTVVRVSLDYQVPGHFFGQAAGKVLSGITEQQVREDLRRFKELMEAGEVATTEGQPHGVRSFVDIKNPI